MVAMNPPLTLLLSSVNWPQFWNSPLSLRYRTLVPFVFVLNRNGRLVPELQENNQASHYSFYDLILMKECQYCQLCVSVKMSRADPGFPRREYQPPRVGCRPIIVFSNASWQWKKLLIYMSPVVNAHLPLQTSSSVVVFGETQSRNS